MLTSMKKQLSTITKYLSKSPEIKKWQLSPVSHEGLERTVVIPALAESASLLKTLASLAENSTDQLSATLVICVINNREPGISSKEEIEDNGITLDYLENFSKNMDAPASCPDPESFRKVRACGMKIAYVDASTPGRELPKKGGVGHARKIGMDLTLSLFDYSDRKDGLIICLDADTLVEGNYLSEIRRHFEKHDHAAAVIAFSHILPEEEESRAAAIAYELYLRYYEAGLRYAGSPYAYHTIGSTMVCRATAYAAVGGMNRKRAGEDFYFLQNLAKYGRVGHITGTTVYPSMRISDRVPFGTGRKMGELAGSSDKSIPFYNPEIFRMLRDFIAFLNGSDVSEMDGVAALNACREIDGVLADYLDAKNFDETWDKIKQNSKDEKQFRRNLHVWFDAFQTLKLVHHLRDNRYGIVDMIPALKSLLAMTGRECEILEEDVAEKMLKFMREGLK